MSGHGWGVGACLFSEISSMRKMLENFYGSLSSLNPKTMQEEEKHNGQFRGALRFASESSNGFANIQNNCIETKDEEKSYLRVKNHQM